MGNPLTVQSDRQAAATPRPEASTEIWLEDPPPAGDSFVDAAEAAALREEVDQLRQALACRGAVIDQAIGIVMALGRLPADEAWNVLREVTQRTNSKPHLVAQLLTAWAGSGELHLGVRIALEEAVREREAREGRPGPLCAG
ncbi:ANTAR domain-containing protein [Streptomyces sp. NPDC006475]|uniref:ANTAR domain-containing protein n=1 Tax=Streptomyces sp. NPDC006475 TaxID=3155719 RepID=UPI0033A03929